MGLFSKSKEKKENSLPPPPPVPQQPNVGQQGMMPPQDVMQGTTLERPPVPGINSESIGDIKNQVMDSASLEIKSEGNDAHTTGIQQQELFQSTSTEQEDNFELDNSLFDFSNLDLPNATEGKSVRNSVGESFSSELDELTNEGTVDTNIENQEELSFIQNNSGYGQKRTEGETFFVTTSQYKSFLEIIDRVKEKVKDSSDVHLRLLDIKTEEDIEYENLRKNFEFIEDKLYEVDRLIFEK